MAMKLYFTLEIGDESENQTLILMGMVILIQLRKLLTYNLDLNGKCRVNARSQAMHTMLEKLMNIPHIRRNDWNLQQILYAKSSPAMLDTIPPRVKTKLNPNSVSPSARESNN